MSRLSLSLDAEAAEPEPQANGESALDVDSCAFVVVGASGDLARKKTYPALFKLFCMSLLPKHTTPVPTIALIPRAVPAGQARESFFTAVC